MPLKNMENDEFIETYIIVKNKKANEIPMTTAKEELMEDFLEDWEEVFGDYNNGE